MACELVPWQSYMAGAVLEPLEYRPNPDEMTCDDERNRLNVFYLPTGGCRRLRRISTFDKRFLNKRIAEYCLNVHLLAIFGRPNFDINISCPGLLDIHAYKNKKKSSLKNRWAQDRVAESIANTVLQTSQTIFHQLNVASYQWQFGRRDTRYMPMMPREPYVWAQWHTGKISQAKFAVFVFPPWVFQLGDLSAFVYADVFRDAQPFQGGTYKWDVGQMLWAMIHDFCAHHGIHHFVLTTYDTWIFGLFTESYRAAFVRDAMNYDEQCPTVLQTLVFWMDAAMRDHPRC